MLIAEEWDKNR